MQEVVETYKMLIFDEKLQKKSLKAWIIKEKAVSLLRQEVIPGYLVSFRVGARPNRHYSCFIRESLLMVPLLLFCVAPNECAEDINVSST